MKDELFHYEIIRGALRYTIHFPTYVFNPMGDPFPQAAYDLDKLQSFMEYARQFPVKVLAGIILLTSAPMARFINKNIAGGNVPQVLVNEMAQAPKGTAIC